MAKKRGRKGRKTHGSMPRSGNNSYQEAFDILSDELVPFTRELAEWYLSLPKFDGERKIDKDHSGRIVKLMESGKWTEGQGEISVAQFPDRTVFRLNGQHRCSARVALGDDNFVPLIRLVKYRVTDIDVYKDLYRRFNNPDYDKSRTSGHFAMLDLYGAPGFDGISKRACMCLAQGYRYWIAGRFSNTGRTVTTDEVITGLRNEHMGLAYKVAKIIQMFLDGGNTLTHLKRAPVFSALFETCKFPNIASAFWTKVAEGLFNNKNDPAMVLNGYLMRTGLGNKNRARNVTQLATQDEMYAVCVRCFNAHHAGKMLTKSPPSSGKRPVAK